MNKKIIISKTITFFFVVIFVVLFSKVFQSENTLIGVTTITAALMLLNKNLTSHIKENILILTGANLLLGLFSFLAAYNPMLGLFFTFISMFGICYISALDLKAQLYIPFGLEYIFMLCNPIQASDLNLRLFSLLFGSLFIVGINIINCKINNIKCENTPFDLDSLFNILKNNFNLNSLELKYSIRCALSVSISTFIMQITNIPEARWLIFTSFAIILPYHEHSRQKSINRLKGTFCGVLGFLIIFSFVQSNLIKMLIILIMGYLDSYSQNYTQKMFFVTNSALGSCFIYNNALHLAISRLCFVILGIALSLFISKTILSHTLEKQPTCAVN